MAYLGSKTAAGVAETIIAQMPPHDTYIEAFAGTLAVMRAKPRAAREIAIEVDAQTIADYPPPAHAELIHGDALEELARFDYANAGRVLIYADPPYPLETRSSRHRYRHDFDEGQHVQLLALLRNLPAPKVSVIVSSYANQFYERELGLWRTLQFQAMTRGGPRTEQLWMNFFTNKRHWHTFAGSNFTERQRIKRKAARWKANYQALPHGERLAILAALLEVDSDAV